MQNKEHAASLKKKKKTKKWIMHPYKMLIQKLTAEILILGWGKKGKKSYQDWLPVIQIEQLLFIAIELPGSLLTTVRAL